MTPEELKFVKKLALWGMIFALVTLGISLAIAYFRIGV